jgi:hypothetical protein
MDSRQASGTRPLPAPSAMCWFIRGVVSAPVFPQDPALRICDPAETFIGLAMANYHYPATAAVVSTRAIAGLRKFIAPSLFPSEQSRASHVLQRDR